MQSLRRLIYQAIFLVGQKSQPNPKVNSCVLCHRDATEFDKFYLICSGFLGGKTEAGICPDCYQQQVDSLPDDKKKRLISNLTP